MATAGDGSSSSAVPGLDRDTSGAGGLSASTASFEGGASQLPDLSMPSQLEREQATFMAFWEAVAAMGAGGVRQFMHTEQLHLLLLHDGYQRLLPPATATVLTAHLNNTDPLGATAPSGTAANGSATTATTVTAGMTGMTGATDMTATTTTGALDASRPAATHAPHGSHRLFSQSWTWDGAMDVLRQRLQTWSSFVLLKDTFVRLFTTRDAANSGHPVHSFLLIHLAVQDGVVAVHVSFLRATPEERRRALASLAEALVRPEASLMRTSDRQSTDVAHTATHTEPHLPVSSAGGHSARVSESVGGGVSSAAAESIASVSGTTVSNAVHVSAVSSSSGTPEATETAAAGAGEGRNSTENEATGSLHSGNSLTDNLDGDGGGRTHSAFSFGHSVTPCGFSDTGEAWTEYTTHVKAAVTAENASGTTTPAAPRATAPHEQDPLFATDTAHVVRVLMGRE